MTRVLITVFDALRPEFVRPDLMPNLCAFADRGGRFLDHHSTFPTETRVNQSAVITGCYPRRHGVVANRFPLADAAPGTVVNTGDDHVFEAMLNGLRDRLLQVPTLGETLAANGLTYATVSSGTSGGGRLINLHAAETGGLRFTLRRPDASVPAGLEMRIADRIGPIPPDALPGVAWNDYAVAAYLNVIEPEYQPDVMLLWLCEPDESFHRFGIGSPESETAIRAVDAAFGRILSTHAAALEDGGLHIFAMSDHGQVTLAGDKLDVTARMVAAGFNASTSPADDPDYTVVVHNAGGIWVRDSAPGKIAAMAAWLKDQPWCGPLFTRTEVTDCLSISEICADHARAPDIYLALASDDGVNDHGLPGLSADNSPYPAGGGCHGGLSRYELHNTLAIGGHLVRHGARIATPSGNVDILPTVLSLLGVPPVGIVDGRVLSEAFKATDQVSRSVEAGSGRTRLVVQEYQGTRYLDRAYTR